MMSEYSLPSDWFSVVVAKASPAPSQSLVRSQNTSRVAERLVISSPLWLDDSSCQSLSPAHVPPSSSSSYGDAAVAPPPTCRLPTPGWNGNHRDIYPSSSHGWLSPDSQSWGRSQTPEQRVCVSCGASSAPLWRRDAAGGYLCHTCNIRQEVTHRALLKPKRRASVCQGSGAACVNCLTATTTLWRRNSAGQKVCNACGLYYRLHQVERPLEMKKDGIRTRKRKPTNKRSRKCDQSGSRLSLLAPPTEAAP